MYTPLDLRTANFIFFCVPGKLQMTFYRFWYWEIKNTLMAANLSYSACWKRTGRTCFEVRSAPYNATGRVVTARALGPVGRRFPRARKYMRGVLYLRVPRFLTILTVALASLVKILLLEVKGLSLRTHTCCLA